MNPRCPNSMLIKRLKIVKILSITLENVTGIILFRILPGLVIMPLPSMSGAIDPMTSKRSCIGDGDMLVAYEKPIPEDIPISI